MGTIRQEYDPSWMQPAVNMTRSCSSTGSLKQIQYFLLYIIRQFSRGPADPDRITCTWGSDTYENGTRSGLRTLRYSVQH